MAVVFAASTNKGGVGKTSLISNLAAALSVSKPDKRILIIDMDAQGNSALAYGIKPAEITDTVFDVMTGEKTIDEIRLPLENNLFLAPANKDMGTIEFEVLLNPDKYPNPLKLLKPAVDKAREQYDYILIDSPPSLSMIAGNILAAADRIIIPFEPEVFAVQGLVWVVEEINKFKKKVNPSLELSGIVGMKVDTRTTLHSEMLQKAKRYALEHDYKMFETIIPRSIRFASSTAYEGKPAVWTDKSHPIVAAYFELLEEVLENVSP